ncbi:MAG TPA: SDR family NAD(P)-dependent oxidoreductase [Alphaproteobacteria bacterium]|jgi:NAD(P)-dependent dehydrogenase (short-subunit alcohol dehydrogenase family)|nr:SDR family NAD(P)-dependent oxidoreductase [Alphaproteobacteria bacterium]
MKISGIAAVVTGGGSGIGAATARHLASLGAKVTVLDVNQENAEAVAKEIGGLAQLCDVTDADSATKALATAKEKHGAARLVVNCAGIAAGSRVLGREGPHDLALFRRVIEINLIGSFNILRLAAADMSTLSEMEDGERGCIINTASVAAFEGQIGQAAYSASKGGIVGLTLPAARELAKFGIRVVTMAPGLIETPLFAKLDAGAVESLVASTLFPHRLGKPEELARLIQHIAENVLINGETIRIDGAIRLAPK